ncbi:uncharacterized protein LOC125563107, partial [Nematostella vectensis]|uniref:uncharacterized protein LOC125563107 n=1 Tax=Nematostella vectensis TaxID=45351 RepID=UPI0020774FE6
RKNIVAKDLRIVLLESPNYRSLVQSRKKNCSPLAHLEPESIRIRYRDEDGDFVNISSKDQFAISDMIRAAQFVEKRIYKKIFIKAKNSQAPRKVRRVDAPGPSTRCELAPKQLTFRGGLLPTDEEHSTIQPTSLLDCKQREMNDNLTVLKVQATTSGDELQKLQQQDREFASLSDVCGRMCNDCHAAGHTKMT